MIYVFKRTWSTLNADIIKRHRQSCRLLSKFKFSAAVSPRVFINTCLMVISGIEKRKSTIIPDVISFTVGFAVPHEACAGFVQKLLAFLAFEAGCVPLQVWSHPQNPLVVYLTSAPHAMAKPSRFFWKKG